MSTIRCVYTQAPNFPATDQHPDAVRYAVGAYIVDAIGVAPTLLEVQTMLGLTTTRASVQAQINALEATQIAPRFSREGILGLILSNYMGKNATLTQAQAVANLTTSTHPDYNVGYARLKVFDDAIVALRVKMTALP